MWAWTAGKGWISYSECGNSATKSAEPFRRLGEDATISQQTTKVSEDNVRTDNTVIVWKMQVQCEIEYQQWNSLFTATTNDHGLSPSEP